MHYTNFLCPGLCRRVWFSLASIDTKSPSLCNCPEHSQCRIAQPTELESFLELWHIWVFVNPSPLLLKTEKKLVLCNFSAQEGGTPGRVHNYLTSSTKALTIRRMKVIVQYIYVHVYKRDNKIPVNFKPPCVSLIIKYLDSFWAKLNPSHAATAPPSHWDSPRNQFLTTIDKV